MTSMAMETKIVPNITVSVSAPPKSGKTYFAMTFPDPIKFFSFDRTNGTRWIAKTKFPTKKIDITEYSLPIIETGDERGWAQPLWLQFQKDYDKTIAGGEYKTLVIDPATVLWMINHHAQLEETEKKKLGTTAYYQPNLRFGALFYKASVGGVNLVTIQHVKETYETVLDSSGREQQKKTGETKLDGWSRTEGAADVNIVMAMIGAGAKTMPRATIKSCGFDKNLKDVSFDDLNYSKLLAVLGV
jgi:hypothetical protein